MSKGPSALLDRLRETLADIGQKFSNDHFEAQLDSAIRSANDRIESAKSELNVARANKISSAKKVADAASECKELESRAVSALQSRKKRQAHSLVDEIGIVSSERMKWEEALAQASEAEKERTLEIELLEGQVKRLKYQLSVRRASTNLQRTQEAILRSGRRPDDPESVRQEVGKKPETPQQLMARLEKLALKKSTKAQQHKKERTDK